MIMLTHRTRGAAHRMVHRRLMELPVVVGKVDRLRMESVVRMERS